jgi:hypothetical protein
VAELETEVVGGKDVDIPVEITAAGSEGLGDAVSTSRWNAEMW